MALSIRDTQHEWHSAYNVFCAECRILFSIMLVLLCWIYAECRCAECRHAECHGATKRTIIIFDLLLINKFMEYGWYIGASTIGIWRSLQWHLAYRCNTTQPSDYGTWLRHSTLYSYPTHTYKPGKTNWRGRLSTVDLLVLTSLDQLLLKLKTLFTFLLNKLP